MCTLDVCLCQEFSVIFLRSTIYNIRVAVITGGVETVNCSVTCADLWVWAVMKINIKVSANEKR